MPDHCRIGSLEIMPRFVVQTESDHCRIGSLEIVDVLPLMTLRDHCRIGSLEKGQPAFW